MENIEWPNECREQAERRVLVEIKYLHDALETYLVSMPLNGCNDTRVGYTREVSNIFYRIGRCQIMSSVAGRVYILNHINVVDELMNFLLLSINYTATLTQLKDVTDEIRNIRNALYRELTEKSTMVVAKP